MRPVPLRWRISLLVTLVLVAASAVVCCVAYYQVSSSLYGGIDRTLTAMVNGVFAAIEDAESPSETEADLKSITGNVALGRAGRYRVWVDGAKKDLYASASPQTPDRQWMWQLDHVPRPDLGQTVFFDAGRDGTEYHVAWSRLQTDGRVTNVLVAISAARVRHDLREFLNILLVVASSVTIGAVALGVGIVLWSLRPIDRTAQRLRTITHHDLGRAHLEDIQTPAELRPFVDALDKMLARLDEAMRRQAEFTGDASHELRTPLASAKSTLQAANSMPRSPEQYRQAIDETLGDLDRMERLIRQLLALARMDENQPAGLREPVRLDEMLADLAASASEAEAAHASPAEAETDQPHRPRVLCEPMAAVTVAGSGDQLQQLFRNLIDNALRHGPADGTVTLSLALDSSHRAIVKVHDAGGKIPPEAIGRLFDRFYRADPSRSSATGGTGLGLAIVREIVRRHGGTVDITSTPEAGTTVTVKLPTK